MSSTTTLGDFTHVSNSNLKVLNVTKTRNNLDVEVSMLTAFTPLDSPQTTFTDLSGVKKITYLVLTNSSVSAGLGVTIRLNNNGHSVILYSGSIGLDDHIEVITPQSAIYLNGEDMEIEHFKGTGNGNLIYQYEDLGA